MNRKHYVLIESNDILVNGFDSWLCPWEDRDAFLTPPLEEMEIGQPWNLTLTVLTMDEEEYAAYFQEHDIEIA
jgi:hypothetical protein